MRQAAAPALIALALAVSAVARASPSDDAAFYVADEPTLARCAREVAPLAAAIRRARGARATRAPAARVEAEERAVGRVAGAVAACRRRVGLDPPLGVNAMPAHRPPPPHHRLAAPWLASVERLDGLAVDLGVVQHALYGPSSSRCQFALGEAATSGGRVVTTFAIGRDGRARRVASEATGEAAARVVPCAEALLDAALLPALPREARLRVTLVFPPFGDRTPARGSPSTATPRAIESAPDAGGAPLSASVAEENERTLRYAADELAACHAAAAPPAPAGVVRFALAIGSSGHVASPELLADTLERPDLHGCLLAPLRRERYAPAPRPYVLRFEVALAPR
ncbi:MAG: hypothetical protein KF729_08035 [Sandaracinaceae bacterium]|nr:hypothetical protein [Sandaracinaceae bacterium]